MWYWKRQSFTENSPESLSPIHLPSVVLGLDGQWMPWCGTGCFHVHSLPCSLSPVSAHHFSCSALLLFPEVSVTSLTLIPAPWWKVLSIKQNKESFEESAQRFWPLVTSKYHQRLLDSVTSGGPWYVANIPKFTAWSLKKVTLDPQ